MKNKEVEQYLKDIRIIFPCFEKEEKMYFERLKNDILKHNNVNDTLSYIDCINLYGEPKNIVFSFYEDIETQDIVKKLKKRKYIKIITFTFLTFLFIITILTSLFFWNAYNEAKDSFIQREEIEIIQE